MNERSVAHLRTVAEAWATPLDAPIYPRYPIPFRDVEFLTLQYRTDPHAIRRLLPEPLVPTGDTVLLHVARMGDVPSSLRTSTNAT